MADSERALQLRHKAIGLNSPSFMYGKQLELNLITFKEITNHSDSQESTLRMKQHCKAANLLQNCYLALLVLIFELTAALQHINISSVEGMTGSIYDSSRSTS